MANFNNKQKYRLDLSRPLTWQEGDENERFPTQWEQTREYKQGQVVLYDDRYTAGSTAYGNLSYFQAIVDVPIGASTPGLPTGSTAAIQPNNPYWERIGQLDEVTGIGPAGPIGAQGDQGLTGAQGATGQTGETGAQGATGQTGADSIVAGPQGDQGLQGPQGPAGPGGTAPGPQGDQGPIGPQGNQGNIGPIGPQGPGGTGGVINRTLGSVKLNINQDVLQGNTVGNTGYFPFGVDEINPGYFEYDELESASVYLSAPEEITSIYGTVQGITWQGGYQSVFRIYEFLGTGGGTATLINQWTVNPTTDIGPGKAFALTGNVTLQSNHRYAIEVVSAGFTNSSYNPSIQFTGQAAVMGIAGPQGGIGPLGPTGAQGEVGLAGSAGAQGNVGPTGPPASYGAAANLMSVWTANSGVNQNIVSGTDTEVGFDTQIYGIDATGIIDGATALEPIGVVYNEWALVGGTGSDYYVEYSLGLQEVDADTTFYSQLEYQIGQTGPWVSLPGSRIDWTNGIGVVGIDTISQAVIYSVTGTTADNIKVHLYNTGGGDIRLRPNSTSINIFRLQGLKGATGAQGTQGTQGVPGAQGTPGVTGAGGTGSQQNLILSETVYAEWSNAVGADKMYFPLYGDGDGMFTPSFNNSENHLQFFPSNAVFEQMHWNLLYAQTIPSFVGTTDFDLELIRYNGLTGGTAIVDQTFSFTNITADPGDSIPFTNGLGVGPTMSLNGGNRYCWAYANHNGPGPGDGWGFSITALSAGFAGAAGPQGPIGPQGEAGPSSTVPGPQGPAGPAGGPVGPQGASGIDGSDGANSGRWKFDSTSTAPSAPGIQDFNTNNTDTSLITELAINKQSAYGATYDYGLWLVAIKNSLSAQRQVILQIHELDSSDIMGIYEVTGATNNAFYLTCSVSTIVSNGTLNNNKDYSISWVAFGAEGPTGPQGATGVTGVTGQTGATGGGIGGSGAVPNITIWGGPSTITDDDDFTWNDQTGGVTFPRTMRITGTGGEGETVGGIIVDISGDPTPLNLVQYMAQRLIVEAPGSTHNPLKMQDTVGTLDLRYSGTGSQTSGNVGPALVFNYQDDAATGGQQSMIRIVKSFSNEEIKDGSLLILGTRESDGGGGAANVIESIRIGDNQYVGIDFIKSNNLSPFRMLTLGHDDVNENVLAIHEGISPATLTSYGQFYVKASDGHPWYITPGGTAYDLTDTGGGGGGGGLVSTFKNANYTAVSGDLVVAGASTMAITLPTAAENLIVGVKTVIAPVDIEVLSAAAAETIDGNDRSVTGEPMRNLFDYTEFQTYSDDGGTTWKWIIK